jgi:ATP diphosphatase
VHFDFEGARAARAKVDEELAELDEVATDAAGDAAAAARAAEELGDVLFAVVNWARHLGLDPEESLRAANAKFEHRFRRMEALVLERGLDPARLDPAQWDALWRLAKASAPRSRGP